MRASSPTLEPRREEAIALDDLLERVEELADAYGSELLSHFEPWIERAREAASRNAPAGELRRVRDGLEETLLSTACAHADALVLEHARQIDALLSRAVTLGTAPQDVAAVIVDPRSPDVPPALHTRPWPISVERREVLARELESSAPNTAAALRSPKTTDEHDVVVVTVGRVMRTTRAAPAYGDA